jgi:hypothetical protein
MDIDQEAEFAITMRQPDPDGCPLRVIEKNPKNGSASLRFVFAKDIFIGPKLDSAPSFDISGGSAGLWSVNGVSQCDKWTIKPRTDASAKAIFGVHAIVKYFDEQTGQNVQLTKFLFGDYIIIKRPGALADTWNKSVEFAKNKVPEELFAGMLFLLTGVRKEFLTAWKRLHEPSLPSMRGK